MSVTGERGKNIDAGRPGRAETIPRLSTGNRRADEVLGGGFPLNTINLVVGHPGTGKTLFAQQMVFHNASDERPILYFTTMSEPLSKVVRFLQTYTFFDESKIGRSVIYEDLGPQLNKDGPGAIVEAINAAIRTHRPHIIVIDSFKVVRDLVPSTEEMRRLMFQLAGLLSAYQVTTFLIGEYDTGRAQQSPEFSICDCIIELLREHEEPRQARFIRVTKLRGCAYQEGLHAISLSSDGVKVYPRFVTPETAPNYDVYERRVSTGCPAVDAMVEGGIWQGSTTMVAGPTGSGKTTLGLQFATGGLKAGAPALYVNFQENPTQLHRRLEAVMPGLDDEEYQEIHCMYYSPVELPPDSIIGRIFETVSTSHIERVVIDAVGDLLHMASGLSRLHDYLYALSEYFSVRGITAMLLMETQLLGERSLHISRFSQMASNVILLEAEYDEETRRFIRILKTRNSAHDPRRRRYSISGKGLELEKHV